MADIQSLAADFGNGEVTVYFKRRNLDQMDAVIKAEADGHVEVLVTTLVTRCMNKEGSMMFGNSDRKKIRTEFDPVEVLRVTRIIREFDMEQEKAMGN